MRPHSKLGEVPNTSQPGGRERSAATEATARTASRPPIQRRSPIGMERTSRAMAAPAARGPIGMVRPPRLSVCPDAVIAQASSIDGPR